MGKQDVFKVGDRVRITHTAEGEVSKVTPDGFYIRRGNEHFYHFTHLSKYDSSIEVLEPEYEHGEFYKDRFGSVFFYCGGGWYGFGAGQPCDNDVPVRPLRKLVPEVGE